MDELHFEPITPNFLSLWDALRGEKKESFDEETEDDCAFLLDKSGLDARGLLAHNGEEYIGYAILIPINRELKHLTNRTLPPFFAHCAKRADWQTRLCTLASTVPFTTPYHLYDLAIAPHLRGNGIGPLLLSKTLDTCLFGDDLKIGFIDQDNTPSLHSTLRTGNIITEKTPASYDGDHPSYVSIFGKHLAPATAPVLISGTIQQQLEHILSRKQCAAYNENKELCYARFPK